MNQRQSGFQMVHLYDHHKELSYRTLQPLYVEMQYTKTAAAVTAAGYVLLLGQRNEKGKVLRYVPGILLLLLGSWIRF